MTPCQSKPPKKGCVPVEDMDKGYGCNLTPHGVSCFNDLWIDMANMVPNNDHQISIGGCTKSTGVFEEPPVIFQFQDEVIDQGAG